MVTNFNNRIVLTKPISLGNRSNNDLPLDIRTRIESIDEVFKIPFPYVGMIFYVIDEDTYYSVKTLKGGEILLGKPSTFSQNLKIDKYEKLSKTLSLDSLDLSEYAKQTYVDNMLKNHTHQYENLEGRPINLSEFNNDVHYATITYVDNEVDKCKKIMTTEDIDNIINELFK